jgi:hypothetical protein
MSVVVNTQDLKAYYITRAYGVERTVKAVDVSLLLFKKVKSTDSQENRAAANPHCSKSC